ncbi:hypothetical protein LPUS_12340 [Lasallia pustulata]|uniref:Protein BNI4 n=1 Tax=Lasallia pustulata TaxID=136370 RepID=A0A1W5DE29_9LECA|nr:hypothetical protein LPUS_12340 [Lasallia pustulata]
MLQTRPSSASGTFQSGPQGQQHQRSGQTPLNLYSSGMTTGSYRGQISSSPLVPYAFASTPSLVNGANPLRQNPTIPHLRPENRTSSAPVLPHLYPNATGNTINSGRPLYTMTGSTSTPSLSSALNPNMAFQQRSTKDDSSIPTEASAQVAPRPLSAIDLNSSLPSPASAKSMPDRYRRGNSRVQTSGPTIHNHAVSGGSAPPSGSGMATVGHLYSPLSQSNTSPPMLSPSSTYRGSPMTSSIDNHAFAAQTRQSSVDDMSLYRQPSTEQAKRYRRRSASSLEAVEFTTQFIDSQGQPFAASQKSLPVIPNLPSHEHRDTRVLPTPPPSSSHGRSGSDESKSSVRSHSRPSSAKREACASVATTANPTALQATPVSKHEAKLVTIPPRASSSDAHKRLTNPSPLSRPIAMSPDSPSFKDSLANPKLSRSAEPLTPATNAVNVTIPESPAAQHLAALNKKEAKKEGKPSRLRRAFSFGSAAELRKASAENNINNVSVERAKLRKERYQDEHEAEQAAIVQKQEAGGLGEGIYSGQGHFFTGSTDNLSISSTASSASVMIRKMGKGMKKSTRSLVGLFRPKSVIGVPAADSAVPEPSLAQVAMVTVEAERERVNVNVDPHDQIGGGTGFPKLERNSLDSASVITDPTSSHHDRSFDNARPRRSIVGGEKERAEVLAAVKKGILKRNGTDSGNSSPVIRPADARATDFSLPPIALVSDSPGSSTPSTPGDDQHPRLGHRRTDSVTIEGEDYFMSIAKFASGDSKSIPGTPRSIARNISFSPRIQFHDTWTSVEYDRRGEIATCNRLTPMLAQQIKEELNTFKMEMEVHEHSKVYTHFF